jgi:hypothetical protein
MSDLSEETWFLLRVFCAIKTSFLSLTRGLLLLPQPLSREREAFPTKGKKRAGLERLLIFCFRFSQNLPLPEKKGGFRKVIDFLF